MRNANGVKMSDNEKKSEQEHVRRFSGAKQRQKNVQKKCAARAKLLFC